MTIENIGSVGKVSIDSFIPKIEVKKQWWVIIVLGIMTAAIQSNTLWFVNFVHVFAGILWTGTDLFMGFMIGPILRKVDFTTRRNIIVRLMPKMLFYMPLLSIVTVTAGWYMAVRLGLFSLPFPYIWWLIAAIVIVALMMVQGLGFLLPTNLRIYFEMRKENPDGKKIGRLMKNYVRVRNRDLVLIKYFISIRI